MQISLIHILKGGTGFTSAIITIEAFKLPILITLTKIC